MVDRAAPPPGGAAGLHEGPPVEPRASASVVVVRPGNPWQVLLMRRPREVDFAGGAYVFPGGSVHDEDRVFADPLRAAAVRELFEEVGILLARGRRGPARAADAVRLRQTLAGGVAWPAALRQLELLPNFDRLTLFARWITPEQVRRRFDTSFYLARLPAGQEVQPSADEVSDWVWIEPARALEDSSIVLVYATRHLLLALARERDAARMIARYRRRKTIAAVRPRIVETDSGLTIVH